MTLSPASWASGQMPAKINDTIVWFKLNNGFTLLKDTSHTEAMTVTITNSSQIVEYIEHRLKQEDVFHVLVMVHIITPSTNPNSPPPPPPSPAPAPAPSNAQSPSNNGPAHTFYCWPITIGYGYSALQDTDDVGCKSIGSSVVPGNQTNRANATSVTSGGSTGLLVGSAQIGG